MLGFFYDYHFLIIIIARLLINAHLIPGRINDG
jgi:hypothetical protein